MRKLALLATVVSLLTAALLIGCNRAANQPSGTPEEMEASYAEEQASGTMGAAEPTAGQDVPPEELNPGNP